MDSSPEIFYSGWDPTQSTSADELPDSLSLPNSTPTPRGLNFASLSSLDLAGYHPSQAPSQTPAANVHNSQTQAGSTAGQSSPQATPTPSERGRNSSRGRGRPTPIGKTGSMSSAQSATPQVAPKATLAAAFSNSTDTRFQMVESQMTMERERMQHEDARADKKDERERLADERKDKQLEAQLQWERDQYNLEGDRMDKKEAHKKAIRDEKASMVRELISKGISPSEIEALKLKTKQVSQESKTK
ncbi:hypothetical protein PGT21_009558 [Puccinia graminis f. sp. tritici]|nr:hypothetical protein PGT21_009558 [Puccinia graminis f. sp. tritici]